MFGCYSIAGCKNANIISTTDKRFSVARTTILRIKKAILVVYRST